MMISWCCRISCVWLIRGQDYCCEIFWGIFLQGQHRDAVVQREPGFHLKRGAEVDSAVYMLLTLEAWRIQERMGHEFFLLGFRNSQRPCSKWQESLGMKETLWGHYMKLWKWIICFRHKDVGDTRALSHQPTKWNQNKGGLYVARSKVVEAKHLSLVDTAHGMVRFCSLPC